MLKPRAEACAAALVLVGLVLQTSPVMAQMIAGSSLPDPAGEARPAILARATRATLPADLVTKIAQQAEARHLSAGEYPDLPRSSADAVIATFCGTVTDANRAAFRTANTGNGLPADFDFGRPLGAQAFKWQWPACLYVRAQPVNVTVQNGKSLSDIFLKLTGKPGNYKTILAFFKVKSPDVQPGDHVTGSYASLASALVPKSGFDLSAILGASPAAAAVPTPPPPGKRANEIIVARSSAADGAPYAPPEECKQVKPYAFAVDRLRLALALPDDLQNNNTVKVLVADNGFRGGTAQSGKIIFAGHFDKRMFDVRQNVAGEDSIGPNVAGDDGALMTPLIDTLVVPSVDEVSGHGTHVTGLVVGGAALGLESGIFDIPGATPKESWLRTSELPLAAGTQTVSVEAFKSMTQIRLFSADIVNMSVRYGPDIEPFVENLLTDRPDTLFIAAAGNDGHPVLSKTQGIESSYPAASGGPGKPNIITVAAEDGLGYLTSFSNTGMQVDIAAPGCNLISWLDGSRAAALSGTSQAAPMITLTAVLLAHKGLDAPRIKRRLLLSGDLIVGHWSTAADGHPVIAPYGDGDTIAIASRSRLNIVKALYFPMDYVRFEYLAPGAPAGTPKRSVEGLGKITFTGKAQCGADPVDAAFLLAGKRGPSAQLWCFQKGSWVAERGSFKKDATVQFTFDHAILNDGSTDVTIPQGKVMTIEPDDIQEFVLSDSDMTFVERQ